jgi:hypothetical protein
MSPTTKSPSTSDMGRGRELELDSPAYNFRVDAELRDGQWYGLLWLFDGTPGEPPLMFCGATEAEGRQLAEDFKATLVNNRPKPQDQA